MIYEFGSCVLDTATQQLWRDGEAVHVEPQVMAVIVHLVVNHDRVVPKLELLDEVWESRFVSEAALTSRIKLARRACGDNGAEQRIVKTIHSRGYRCVAEVVCRNGDSVPPPVAGGVPTSPLVPVVDPSPRNRSPRRSTSRRSSTVLFGRTRELELLAQALDDASAGRRSAVVLRGGIGLGKSALVAEFIERHDRLAEWHVARGQCIQPLSGPEPFFPWFDAFGSLARSDPAAVTSALDRVAPSWLSQMPALLDDAALQRLERRLLGATPARMLREGVDAIEALAADRPVLLVLEDLQWADECSLDVLNLLLQRAEDAPLLVLGTCRSAGSQLASVLEPAARSGRALLIELQSLGLSEVAALVGDRLGVTSADDAFVSIVADRSAGVPLFAEEVLATWTREGSITVADGSLVVADPLDVLSATVPTTLPAMIEREITHLDGAALVALESAAVAGTRFDAATVAACVDLPVPDTEAVLASLAREHGFIGSAGASVWPDGSVSAEYEFAHELYRQVVYDRVSPSRRARLHATIGDRLESGFGDRAPTIAVTLADHFVAAGDVMRAVRHLRRAGEQANARNAHQFGERFLSDALELLLNAPGNATGECADRARAELDVRMSLGPALVATRGWFDESVSANYERCLELSTTDGSLTAEQAAARYGLATVSELQGRFERTEALLTPLLSDEHLVMEAHELVACSTFHQGSFARSLQTANEVLDRWDEHAYSVLMARIAEHPASSCSSWSSLASWALGRSDESLSLAERAVELGERNLYALSTAVQQRAMLHQIRNEPERCLEWSERCRQVGEDQEFPMRVVQADIYKGWALGVSGSVDEGRALIADGIARFRAAGATLNEAYYLGLHADAALHSDDPGSALALLDEAFDRMHASTRAYFFEPELHRLRARGLIDRNGAAALGQAQAELDRALDVTRSQGAKGFELRALIVRLEIESQYGDPGPWRTALGELLPVWSEQAPTPDVVRAAELTS